VRRRPAAAALALVSLIALVALVGAAVAHSYNGALADANDQLAGANARLEEANGRLEATSSQLQTTLAVVEKQKTEALTQRETAREQEAKARGYLYSTRMLQAWRAEKEKDPARVIQLLRSLIPESPDQKDLREWEWWHLWRKYNGEESTLRGHLGPVNTVAFSPDDKWLASGSDDKTVMVWDTATGMRVYVLQGHKASVTSVAFSPDARLLASASKDKTVQLSLAATGEKLLSLEGHTDDVMCVAFSPDGKNVASGSKDKSVIIWDAETGKKVGVLSGHKSGAFGLAFGMRDMLVSSGDHGPIKFWNYKTGVELPGPDKPLGHTLAVGGLSASGDLKRIVIGDTARLRGEPRPSIDLLDLETMEWSSSIRSKLKQPVWNVAFSPNGQTVAACIGQEIQLLDANTGKELARFQGEGANRGVAYSPDSSRIAVGTENNQILLFSIPGAETRTFKAGERWVASVSFGAKGRLIAAGGGRIWDVLTGRTVINPSNYRVADYNPERFGTHYQRTALSPVDERIAGTPPDAIVDLRTGNSMKLLQRPNKRVPMQHAFSRDGGLVAEASALDWVGVWDARTGFPLGNFMTEHMASCVAFSPDNKWIAAGSGGQDEYVDETWRGGALMVWDVRTGHPLLSLKSLPYSVWSVAFSPDGSRLAAAMGMHQNDRWPGIVQIWETTNWTIQGELRGHIHCVWSVSFNHNGTRIASASGKRGLPDTQGEVILWEVSTGQELWRFRDEDGAVYGVEFSPVGRRLAMGGQGGIVTLLDGTRLAETPRYQRLPEDP
jgi:WD40 repeat protein